MTSHTALERMARDLSTAQHTSLASVVKETNRTLLSDVSGSMDERAAGAEERKIDALRKVVYRIRGEGIDFKQIVFGSEVAVREDIPEPGGGTPLLEAMQLARCINTTMMVVISDGIPDDPEACLSLAREMAVRIDTFYVGPRPHRGEEFMRLLSEASGGTSHVGDLGKGMKALSDEVSKALLALPPAIAL